MAKYNLGVSSRNVKGIDKDNLYINDVAFREIEQDIEMQFDIIRTSLINLNSLLNQSINLNLVKGSRLVVFKGWSRKTKAQALSAVKIKNLLVNNYKKDLRAYALSIINSHIEKLEGVNNDLGGDMNE